MKHITTLSKRRTPALALGLLELAQFGSIFGSFATAFAAILGGLNVGTTALGNFINAAQDKNATPIKS